VVSQDHSQFEVVFLNQVEEPLVYVFCADIAAEHHLRNPSFSDVIENQLQIVFVLFGLAEVVHFA
jgi:hypothetical protein